MRTLALAALLLATACGKPLLYAEVEIPSAKVTVPDQAFDAILPTDLCTIPVAQPGSLCSATVVKYDLGQDFRDLVKDASTVEVRLTTLGIALAANDPLGDFGAVRAVYVTVQSPPDGSLPAVEVARYVRDPANPSPSAISVAARSTVELGAYVQAGFISILVDLEADPDPAGLPAFTADVTGDFYLRVVVDWGKKAGL